MENTFDKLGRLVQVKDSNGKLWKSEYDKFGRKTKDTDPLLHLTQRIYDAAGNVVTRIDGNGKYTNYTLDTLNRVTQVSYQDGNVLTYVYNQNGNPMTETGYAFTRTTIYDALDRVTRVTFNFGSFSKDVQYTYDPNGNRKTMVYPDGFTATYVWDADNRLANIQIAGQTWTFIYDNGNRRIAARHPNGLELNATFDQASRLSAIRSKDIGSGSTVEGFTYTYDSIANRRTQGQEANGTSLSFAYDDEYALNSTTYESGSKAYYQYDANDNRRWRNASGGKREYLYFTDSSLDRMKVYNAGGQLVETVTFLYDGNGNNYQKARATTTTYAYDLENRLTQVAVGGSTQATYAYFSDGARIRRTAGGTTTYFLYDFRDFNGYNDILGEYDSTGALVARYVHGPGVDEPLAMFRGGAWYYYHVDGLGSVTMLTDANKVAKNRYVYDDFGAFRAKTEAVQNPYGFTSRETDVLGLVYYRARYYDTEIGRFLTRDPAGMVDGPNLYAYVSGNPASLVDPSGKDPPGAPSVQSPSPLSNTCISLYIYLAVAICVAIISIVFGYAAWSVQTEILPAIVTVSAFGITGQLADFLTAWAVGDWGKVTLSFFTILGWILWIYLRGVWWAGLAFAAKIVSLWFLVIQLVVSAIFIGIAVYQLAAAHCWPFR